MTKDDRFPVGFDPVLRYDRTYSARAPTVKDDNFPVGKRWWDVVAFIEYVCLDSALGAAVWVESRRMVESAWTIEQKRKP